MLRMLRLSASLAVFLALAITAMHLVRSPSPFLLGGLIGGAAFSLVFRAPWAFPDPARHLGVAVIGVGAGALIDSNVLQRIASSPVQIVGGVAATVVFTMLTGLLLLLSPHVNLPTAMFASIAGAASAISGIARELDADEAIVSAVQYARVVLVVVSIASVAPLLGAADHPGSAVAPVVGAEATLPQNLSFTALCVGGGLLLASVVSFSGSRLVIPLLLSMAAALVMAEPVSVPAPLLNVGYGITGLAVGFSFTPATIRLLARLFPLVIVQLVAGIVGCAVIGIGFAHAVGISELAGYLALSPGGLPAVAAIAVESGTDVGLVVTMQLVRILAAILISSVIGTIIKRRSA